MAHQDEFFRPGGTLPPGSQSYVARRADDEIFDALMSAEFVFVLDSRQKGKSSLIVRSLERLRQQGITTIRIDLQRLGANLGAEQWYAGLLHSIGQETGLISALFAYWKENIEVGPMARWFAALEHVVLASIQGPIVVFVDEVDYVQSLPFAADEFFAGIRECYNRRSSTPLFGRLTFCLAGVATPSQLIRKEDVTPFNIGRRVKLTDFTREEIQSYEAPLSTGGRDGRLIVDGIHKWVSGHPYLTQLLASRASTDTAIRTTKDVDTLVHRVLLSSDAREQEPNIADTERRLLEASLPDATKDESRSRILEEYRLLLQSNSVLVNREVPVTSTILLSGVAIENGGRLQIRNKLYRQLFDERWRRNSLPDAEVRRQKAASARAGGRVAAIAFAIICVVTTLWLRLLVLTNDRDHALAESRRLNSINIKSAYDASIALTWERIEDGNFLKAYDLMESQKSAPGRNWEWSFLSKMFDEAKVRRTGDPDSMTKPSWILAAWKEGNALIELTRTEVHRNGQLAAVAPSSKSSAASFISWISLSRNTRSLNERLAIAQSVFPALEQGSIALTEDAKSFVHLVPNKYGFDVVDRATGKQDRFETSFIPIIVCFSHSGRQILVTEEGRGRVSHFYDLATHRELWETRLALNGLGGFSPDDQLIVIPRVAAETIVVRAKDGTIAANLVGHSSPVTGSCWFSDNKRLITCSNDGSARVWDVTKSQQLRVMLTGGLAVLSCALNPDERSVLLLGRDSSLLEWDFDALPPVQTLGLHNAQVMACEVSPGGDRCLTSSMDGTSVLLDLDHSRPIARLQLGVPQRAHPIRFSPDGKLAGLVATDGSVLFVDPADGHVMRRITAVGKHPSDIAISKSGRILLPLAEGGILSLADWHSDPVDRSVPGFVARRIAFSPDESLVAVGGVQGEIALLDGKSLKTKEFLDQRQGLITHVEFSPNGKWLSVSDQYREALLLPLDGLGHRRVLLGHWDRVWGARFSPDSTRLLTNSFDGTARVWDVKTGRLISVLQHGSWVSSAVWSPDGRRVLTAAADNFIRIFDPADGFELLKLSGHRAEVMDARFTPDGHTVVSVSSDNMLKIWRSQDSQVSQPGIAPGNPDKRVPETPTARPAVAPASRPQ